MARMNIRLKKVLAITLSASMLAGMPVYVGAAEESGGTEGSGSSINESLVTGMNRDDTYASYFDRHSDAAYPKQEIVINAKDYKSLSKDEEGIDSGAEVKEFQGEADVLVWQNHGGKAEYEFEVPETGLYNLEMFYYTIKGNNTVIEFAMQLDGEYPFSAAKTFTLDRYWMDESAIEQDSRDNDIRPGQT